MYMNKTIDNKSTVKEKIDFYKFNASRLPKDTDGYSDAIQRIKEIREEEAEAEGE